MLRDLLQLACSQQIGASEPLESVLPSHPPLGQTHSSAHILREQHDSEGQAIRATLQRRRRRSIDNTHARVAARARRNDSAPPIDDAEANAVPVQETFRKQIQALERKIQEADASDKLRLESAIVIQACCRGYAGRTLAKRLNLARQLQEQQLMQAAATTVATGPMASDAEKTAEDDLQGGLDVQELGGTQLYFCPIYSLHCTIANLLVLVL